MTSKTRRILSTLMLVFVMGRFLVIGWHYMSVNSSSQLGDQGDYLQLGLEIKEHGVLTDGTRNPLYPAVISVFAQKDWTYFTLAKFVSLIFGMLSVVAVFLVSKRLFDWNTAVVAAFLFGVNINLIQHGALALTTTLLVLLFLLAWFFMILALRHMKLQYWLLAGFLAGLAYLAKGTGQVLVVAFVLSALLQKGFAVLKRKPFWAFLAVYCVTASPLWMYNLLEFGNPVFNYATSNQMWMEEWHDWYNLRREELPTVLTYVRDHSIGEIVRREWDGVKDLRFVLAKTLFPSKTSAFDTFLLSPWSTFSLLVICLLPIVFFRQTCSYVKKHQPETILTSVLFVMLYLLFAWYTKIVPRGIRFLLPLLPILTIMISSIAVSSVSTICRRIDPGPLRYALRIVGVLVLLGILLWSSASMWDRHDALAKSIFQLDSEYNSFNDYPMQWLQEIAPQGTAIAVAQAHWLPIWKYSDWFQFVRPPDEMSAEEWQQFVGESSAEYVIVDETLLGFQQRELARHIETTEGLLRIDRFPPRWGLCLAYPSFSVKWLVFRLLDQEPLECSVDYDLGEHISLQGYTVSGHEVRAGERLTLLLHWHFRQAPAEDLTVFTQLLGPDGLLYGQKDNLPLEGLIQTSCLPTPGDLVDRYDIEVSESAPQGTYQLLVGIYDSATGERIPVYRDGEPLPDDAIPLDAITVTGE